jgi:hypothetical protein
LKFLQWFIFFAAHVIHSFYCGSSSVKSHRLDRIVEAARDENGSGEQDSDHEHNHGDSINGQDQTPLMTAAAIGDSYGSAASSVFVPRISISPSTSFISPRNSYDMDDHQSSTIFSIPAHLTNSGRYSSTVDDSSVDDNSTAAGSFMEYSRDRTSSRDHGTSERLAKFEREQEIMFQQKRSSIQRELFNVLERNAVKSVRSSVTMGCCISRRDCRSCSICPNATWNYMMHTTMIL